MSEDSGARRNGLERLLGDRPGALVVRLVVISIIVGFLMSVLGLSAQGLVNGFIDFVRDMLQDSTGMLHSLWGYLLTGAALVVPIWLLLRLTSGRRR